MVAKSQVHSSMLVASLRVMFTQLSVNVSRHLCESNHCSQSTELYKNLQKGLQKNKILNNAKETKNPSIMYNMKHCIGVVGTGGMDMVWNGIGIGYGNFIQSYK